MLVTRGDIIIGEWSENLDCYQQSVDLVGDKADRGLHYVGEETGEGEGLAGVALDTETGGRHAGEIRLAFIESQVRPAGEEAEPSQNKSGVGSDDETTQGVEEKEQSREMLNTHPNHALKDCDGVFRDELLESDEEGALNGDATADLGQTVAEGVRISDREAYGDGIWDRTNDRLEDPPAAPHIR